LATIRTLPGQQSRTTLGDPALSRQNDPSPAAGVQTGVTKTVCRRCFYEIRGDLGARCPECGLLYDAHARMIDTRRSEMRSRLPLTLGVHTGAWLLALLVASSGYAVLTDGGWFSFAAVFIGIGFGVLSSAAIGAALVLLVPAPTRRLHAMLWIGSLGLLHTPWLLIPPFVLFGYAVTTLVRWFDPDWAYGVVFLGSLAAFLVWLAVSFVALILWITGAMDRTRALELHESPPMTVLRTLWAVAVWIGCLAVGFMGFSVGVGALMRIVDPFGF